MTPAVPGGALFRLLARPATLLFGFFWLANTMWVSEWILRSHATLLFAYLLPFPAGYLFGQIVQELQHTTFAWALPRLRSALITPLLAVSFCACALTLLAMAHSTRLATSAIALEPLPFAALSFLGFCVGLAMVNRGFLGVTCLGLGAAVGTWTYTTRQLEPGASLVVSIAAAAGGVVCLILLWSPASLRRRSLVPALTMATSRSMSALDRYRAQKLARRTYRGTVWAVGLATAGMAAWVRAAVYARHGFRRLSWYGSMLSAVALSAAMLLFGWGGFEGLLDWQHGVPWMGALLWHPTSSQHFWLGFALVWVAGPTFGGGATAPCSGLSPYLHYPLSRPQRMRVEYLMQLSAVAGSAMVSFLVLGGLAWFTGNGVNGSGSLARLPGFVPPLAALLSVMPFLLWRDSRSELPAARRESPALRVIVNAIVLVGLVAVLAITSLWASQFLASAPVLVSASVCAGLLATSQGLYWRMLVRVYTRGDLI